MKHDLIKALLATANRPEIGDPFAVKRQRKRAAWASRTAAQWRDAHRRLDEAWSRMLAALPEDISDEQLEAMKLPEPPEQAEVDRLHAELWAVIDHDRWPEHLHWGRI